MQETATHMEGLMRRSARRLGFTIIEILIAIVVLVLGITGILALFPTAIDSGNKTVEDSYAAAIAQSVVDAVAVGLRESRYTWSAVGSNEVFTYFIFDHDGVLDPPPAQPELLTGTDQMYAKDYCIILPRARVDESSAPNKASADEPVWVYPVPNQGGTFDGAGADQRKPETIAAPGSRIDNYGPKFWECTTVDDTPALWVSRTYPLGRYRDITDPPLPSGVAAREIRLEYRGEDLVGGGSVVDPTMISVDPYTSYSFAIALKRARVDTTGDGQVTDDDAFSNSLYELRVLVFKNFNQEEADRLTPTSGTPTGAKPLTPKTNVPIKQFITLISI